MSVNLFEKFSQFIEESSLLKFGDRVVVGVSGGPDSVCLLHLLTYFCRNLNISPPIVAHLNHQLREREAQIDVDFVREIAEQWQLPVFVEARSVAELAALRKQSVEETARQIRYAFLWRIAAQTNANKIAVGHQADDQTETVLMHFLRGSGLTGLRGMSPKFSIANLQLHPDDLPDLSQQSPPDLIRPLLSISRREIEEYCQRNKLATRQDHTNRDITFFRNRLRHELLPLLETYNPNVRQVIQRMARVVAADAHLLEQYLEEVWPAIVKSESGQKIEFYRQEWLKLPLSMQRASLRRAVQTLNRNLHNIGFEHIENAIEILHHAQGSAKVTLPLGLEIVLEYDTFKVSRGDLPAPDIDGPWLLPEQLLPVNLPGSTMLPQGGWQLVARVIERKALGNQHLESNDRWEAFLDAEIVGIHPILRTRQPGDKFCPLGMKAGRKKLKSFMIDEKIPAPWRDHVPILTSKDQIFWVCGYRLDERAQVRLDTTRVAHLRFEKIWVT